MWKGEKLPAVLEIEPARKPGSKGEPEGQGEPPGPKGKEAGISADPLSTNFLN
jgi:hypothetical protein